MGVSHCRIELPQAMIVLNIGIAERECIDGPAALASYHWRGFIPEGPPCEGPR
jgi:hypothetical protein